MRCWWSASRIARLGAGSSHGPRRSPAGHASTACRSRRHAGSAPTRHVAALDGFGPDGLLLVAYGQLVPDDLLAIGERPPLNVHPVAAAAPPRRGAGGLHHPGRRSDAGGVSLMVMTPELDAGPIVAQWPVTLTGRETTPELEARLSELTAEVVPAELERWANGALEAEPQDPKQATLIRPFHRADGWLDWRKPAEYLDRQVRALQPWPGAWTTVDGRRLHVRAAHPMPGFDGMPMGSLLPGALPEVATGEGALALDVVQPEGRPAMPADAWRRGLGREHVLLGAGGPDPEKSG